MIYRLYAVCLAAACVLLGGCYETPFPLGSPDSARIDERLLKEWIEETQSPEDKPYRVVIRRFNDREYFIAFSDDNDTAVLTRAFATVIDSVPILNMQNIDSLERKDRTYIFFKYEFDPNGTLQTLMISDQSPLLENKKFSSPAEFAAFVTKNIRNGQLYGYPRRFRPVEAMRVRISS